MGEKNIETDSQGLRDFEPGESTEFVSMPYSCTKKINQGMYPVFVLTQNA
jgi:hypothetical protein